jgi:HSP20 family molecular chaperone IbpA
METLTCTDNPFRGASASSPRFIELLHSKGYFGFLPNEQWTPNVNLYEIELAYLVCVDLAGVDKNKIDLEIVEGRLTIRGKRAVPICPDSGNEQSTTRVRIHLMEIDHGAFARDVELPVNVVSSHITAKYHDGMLWIELPKKR